MTDKPDYFKIMSKLAQAFGTAHSRRELLDLILQSAITTLNAKAASLYLIDADNQQLIPVAQTGLSASYFRSKQSLLTPEIIPLVAQDGYLFSREATADPRLKYPQAKHAEGIASIMALPVKVKGKQRGLFCLFTATPRDFSADEIDFLRVLAQQSGGIVEHGQVLDQLREKTRLFLELAVNIGSSLDIKKILHIMSAEIAEALRVKGTSIRLWDEDRQTLELAASYGLSEKFLHKGPVSAQKSMTQALSGKPVVIKDARTDNRVQYKQETAAEGIVSILSVPIQTKEKIIGVLRLYSAVPRDFTADDIMMVTALAYLGGLAIQNASLYIMVQQDMEDLKDELWSHRSWF
ncbi:MAG: GAF domain-containing protein [Desulfobacca sp.]|nr:GAF domain-containing protein [Desulfobacca sp.]